MTTATRNTNSTARVVIREAKDNCKLHEYSPWKAHVINNGKKKPDELKCVYWGWLLNLKRLRKNNGKKKEKITLNIPKWWI